ncbi:MAG: hypothetical protein ACE5FL_10585 [Myxococcota bacterium]
MQRRGSIWMYLFTVLLAVTAAAVVLPGCGDDSGSDSDSFAQ